MSAHKYQKHGWKKTRRRSGRPKRRRSSTKKGFSLSVPQELRKKLIVAMIAFTGICGLVLMGFFFAVTRNLPNPNSLTERSISQTTKIYDRTGDHLLYEIFGEENRTLVQFQEPFCDPEATLDLSTSGVPLHAIQATIAAEDRKFCDHFGFDIRGFLRAVFQNLRGNRVGGSTLTQQLVKNAILSGEKTITRKVKELVLAVELERRYSKDEILQIYFNEIPYGSTYYGIEAASQNYFGKSVSQLSVAEAATLASLPKAPTTYLNNPDRLLARRNYILSEMQELGFLTETEVEIAMNEETPVDVNISNIEAPHFVLHVKEQLEETYGRRAVEEGGLRVITSLDYDLQSIAEEEVARGVEERGELYGFTNASLVAMDPKNGHVLAMVGSKDFFDNDIDGQVNVATRLRQPGSSFKPIVFTKAFDSGYTPNTVLWDVQTEFPSTTGPYNPQNYDGSERGPIRLRDALQGSLNIPAVKLLYLVGVQPILDFAHTLGYTSLTDPSRYGLSLVLGGGEVQLIEHVGAYGVFANEGTYHQRATILKVEDANGQVLEEWKASEGKQVLDENTARTITHVLSDNNARAYVFGTDSFLQLGDRPVAAKTGTTNDSRDAWLLGYTPSLVAGVWGGNNDNTTMSQTAGGSSVAAPIWNAFMRRAMEGTPVESFTTPDIPRTGKDMLDGSIASTRAIVDKASGKLATEYTPPRYREERLFAEYHTILHYIDRSDPLGPVPERPEQDSQYTAWESAVADWITRQEEETGVVITQSDPPTEFDDVHTPENTPRLTIHSPSDNELLSGRALNIELDANAPRDISRVEFYVDGFFLGADTRRPFTYSGTLPNTISRGVHTLKVAAFDDVDNSNSQTVSIRIETDGVGARVELIDPRNGQTIERTSESYSPVVSLDRPTDYARVTLYAQPLGSTGRLVVDEVEHPTSPFVPLSWLLPETGDWALFASATPTDGGETLETIGVLVHITNPTQTTTEPLSPEASDTDETEEPATEEEIFTVSDPLNPFSTPEE